MVSAVHTLTQFRPSRRCGIPMAIARELARRAAAVRLAEAAGDGNEAEVRRMLGAQGDVDHGRAKSGDFSSRQGVDRRAALLKAADGGHAEVCRALLGDPHGAAESLQARDERGWPALFLAVCGGHFEALEALLDGGASVAATDSSGWTALSWAAFWRSAPMCAELLRRGADPSAADAQMRTPLHWAARNGAQDCCAALIAAGASPSAADSSGSTPLHEAVYGLHAGCCALLMKHGASVAAENSRGETPCDVARRQQTGGEDAERAKSDVLAALGSELQRAAA